MLFVLPAPVHGVSNADLDETAELVFLSPSPAPTVSAALYPALPAGASDRWPPEYKTYTGPSAPRALWPSAGFLDPSSF